MICTLEGDNVGFVDLNFASYIPSHKVYSTARLSYRQPKYGFSAVFEFKAILG